MLALLELEAAELSVVLCDDVFIHDLNRRFADEDHATDVLAFATMETPGPHPNELRSPGNPGPHPGSRAAGLLGDVVISLETAARQAASRRAPVEDEVRLLLAHGLLHLLGYDHRTAAERRIMKARTSALVEAAGTPRRGRRVARS
jgi:probable rRNA maturation factor